MGLRLAGGTYWGGGGATKLVVDRHDVPVVFIELAITLFARKQFVLGQYYPVGVKHDSLEELKGLYTAELVNFFVCAIVSVLDPNALEATDKVENDVVRLNLSLPDIGSGGSVIAREKFWVPKSLGDRW